MIFDWQMLMPGEQSSFSHENQQMTDNMYGFDSGRKTRAIFYK